MSNRLDKFDVSALPLSDFNIGIDVDETGDWVITPLFSAYGLKVAEQKAVDLGMTIEEFIECFVRVKCLGQNIKLP